MSRYQTWRYFDYWLFGAVIVLCIFGVAMIRSAIAGSIGLADLVNRQIIYVFIAMGIILFMALIDYRYWASLSRLMYIFAIVSLLGIFVYGTARFGSARWVDTGLILVQPSEVAKIIMILVLADFFSRHKEDEKDLKWILKSFAMTFFLVIWILLQPNLSTSIVIMVIWFAMAWLSGLQPKYLLVFGLLAILAAMVLFPFLEPYQQTRILNFVFPDENARYGNTYNVDQALISIGSGGWFGMGYGHGSQVQLRFLKVRHTDFIFSAMAEEFGFVGTLLVIAMLAFVIIRCYRTASLAHDTYGSLIAYGFATLIFFQTIVNIGVNLKVIPVTGLTLPFISYGGSSLVSMAIGIGLVESVSMRQKVKS